MSKNKPKISQGTQSVFKENIKDEKLDIDFYEKFITEDEANKLYEEIERNCKWKSEFTKTKRASQAYGDKGIVYNVSIWDKTIETRLISWDKLKCLIPIRDKISKVTGQIFNVCYIQRYPCGRVGINPHRDKEMTPGTYICGLSLGEERTLSMMKFYKDIVKKTDIKLPNGSLYIMKPPTNQYWTHCIEKDKTKNARISLTFRNYNPPPIKRENIQKFLIDTKKDNKVEEEVEIEFESSSEEDTEPESPEIIFVD